MIFLYCCYTGIEAIVALIFIIIVNSTRVKHVEELATYISLHLTLKQVGAKFKAGALVAGNLQGQPT